MRTKTVIVVLIWIICLMLLAACGAGTQDANANGTQIVATFVARITQTAQAAEIDSWLAESDATDTPSAGVTEEPTETDAPFSTATPDPNQQLLSKFRTVTVSNGNLYVRDGLGVPVQITKSGTDHDPIISSDGKKIVFYRGKKFDNVFMVNADGSDEKELVNKTTIPNISISKILSPTFRPGTHQLIFSTYSCEQKCQMGVFMMGTESSTTTEIASGLRTPRNLDDVFTVSSDGQYLAIKNSAQLDLYSMDGKIVQADLAKGPTYAAYWLSDSSGLILLSTWSGDYMIWRYTLNDQHVEKIALDPAPAFDEDIACYVSVSLDRNWVLYQDHDQKKRLGNLKDVKTEVYAWDDNCSVLWSPDSQHFASQTKIGSVDGTPPITIEGHFIAWLDATHYLFSKGKNIIDLQTYIAEVGKESAAAPTNFIWSPEYAVLP